MNRAKQWNVLYIIDERSEFNPYTPLFSVLFNQTDRVTSKEEAMEHFEKNKYDVIVADLSVEPEKAGMLKEMEDKRPGQAIFAMVDPKDEDKLFGIADMGINAFELTPDQFDQALRAIAEYNPADYK